MARSPSRTANPATEHLKSQKRAAIKKNKNAVAAQRTERLSKRDPARLERQIASLRAAGDARPGGLADRDRKTLETLEREVALVRKARGRVHGDTAGDNDGGGRGRGRGAGRDEQRLRRERVQGNNTPHPGAKAGKDENESGSETDPDVRRIPMPRDTPPPVPRQRAPAAVDSAVPTKAQVTYSSAPVMRDLRAAVTGQKFAPAAVRRNVARMSGKGGLVEEEEWERLERAGYAAPKSGAGEGERSAGTEAAGQEGVIAVGGGADGDAKGPRGVRMEEVEDEDG